jgi:MSHA biogenesis protein MshK
MKSRIAAAPIALVMFSAGQAAFAQGLSDPTRPPSFSGVPFDGVAAPAGPVLQSIVLSPKRRLALINGKLIGIGDRVGAATLVAIEIDSVRLREGGGTKVVKLLPEVRKRDAEAAAPRVDTNPAGDVK